MIGDRTGFHWVSLVAADGLSDVAPSFVRDWLIVLCTVLGAILLVLTLREKMVGKKATETVISPDPLRFQKVDALATKAELEAMKDALEGDVEELKKASHEDRIAAREALSRVHQRIDAVAQHGAEMAGELKQITKRLDSLLEIALKRQGGTQS